MAPPLQFRITERLVPAPHRLGRGPVHGLDPGRGDGVVPVAVDVLARAPRHHVERVERERQRQVEDEDEADRIEGQ